MPAIRRALLFLDRSSTLHLRDCYSLRCFFPKDFGSSKGYSPPHLPPCYQDGIRFDLTGFHSLLLTGSRWFLFHPLLRCFISRGCCTLLCSARPLDQRLRASTQGVSPLAAWLCGHKPIHPLNGVYLSCFCFVNFCSLTFAKMAKLCKTQHIMTLLKLLKFPEILKYLTFYRMILSPRLPFFRFRRKN